MSERKGTRVEFYHAGTPRLIATVSGVGAIPGIGDLINIKGETWSVVRVTWAVDHSRTALGSELRANVDLEATP